MFNVNFRLSTEANASTNVPSIQELNFHGVQRKTPMVCTLKESGDIVIIGVNMVYIN